MVLGLRPFTERVGDGNGQPSLDVDDGEELMHVESGVAIALGNRPPESPGTLYISTKRVVWLSDTERTKGYSVDFLSVSLHAVSRDPEAYPLPCIYAQIEIEAGEDNNSGDSDTECSEDLDLSKVTEMRLLPSDSGQLDALFNIFCECAELNPEPDQEDDEENNWVFGDEQMVSDVGDDSEWHLSEDLANPIGCANGNHDLAQAVFEAACGITDKPTEKIHDIDAIDAGDQLSVVDYVEDIYKFYKLTENSKRPNDYMDSQVEINSKMRAVERINRDGGEGAAGRSTCLREERMLGRSQCLVTCDQHAS